MWQWAARGNIQQISYIPQMEEHSPFRLMLLCLGNVTIMFVCVCVATSLIINCTTYFSLHVCKAFLLAFILKHMISAFIVILATCMY